MACLQTTGLRLAQVNEPSKGQGERVNMVAVPELPERPLFKAVEDIPVDAELLVNYGSRYDRSPSRLATQRREMETEQTGDCARLTLEWCMCE